MAVENFTMSTLKHFSIDIYFYKIERIYLIFVALDK